MDGQWVDEAQAKTEYGVTLRRLFPWPVAGHGIGPDQLGGGWATIAPGGSSAPHDHPDLELFIIVAGHGVIAIDGEARPLAKGDVVFLPPGSHHAITNGSDSDPLEFVSLWWDPPVS